MGTTLTGTTPQDTYDSLIKVTDNGPISGTAKYLSDGLGNDSGLALSTGNIGVGYTSPTQKLSVAGNIKIAGAQAGNVAKLNMTRTDSSWSINNETDLRFYNSSSDTDSPANILVAFASTGNVGIGTAAPAALLEANGAIRSTRTGAASQYLQIEGGDASGGFITLAGAAKSLVIRNNCTSSSDIQFEQAVATRFSFTQAGTQILRIDADGVKFGTDSAAANALDDYEEGTWTIGVAFGGASVGVTTSLNTGTYTKIGRQVTVNGRIDLTSKGSSTGAATITGLPFTVANNNANLSAGSFVIQNITFLDQFQGCANTNSTAILLFQTTNLGVVAVVGDTNFANNSIIFLSLTYFV
jgi:hypothetical protein